MCGPDGKNCTRHSDAEFYDARKQAKAAGDKYTSQGFLEYGSIIDGESGQVRGTYVQLSIDDPVAQFSFEMRRHVAPIPKAVALFFGISAVGGATGGVAYYVLGSAATTTTLGLGGAAVAKTVPSHVRRVLNHIKSSNGSAPPGYKGGRTFKNDARGGGQSLPKTDGSGRQVTYRVYDVNPYQQGVNRGAERIVRGSDGSAYFTKDHYKTFTKIE